MLFRKTGWIMDEPTAESAVDETALFDMLQVLFLILNILIVNSMTKKEIFIYGFRNLYLIFQISSQWAS